MVFLNVRQDELTEKNLKELHAAIPDSNAILALEPEELAAKLLFLMRKRFEMQPEQLQPTSFITEVMTEPTPEEGGEGYPRDDRVQIAYALTEAFSWLEAQGLLITFPGEYRSEGRMLSRRAQRIETEEDFRHFEVARRLNRDLLHPAISEKVWLAFVRGDFAEGVFTAMRAVEVAVREAGGFAQKQVGTKLMQAAFGLAGPLRDDEADAAEEDGLMHLFIGAMGSYKNPHSHRNVPMEDAGEAIEIVTFASHLLRIVDARRPAGSI